MQAERLTILLVHELRRVGRGGFQPLQREKDYFIDSALDNQYNRHVRAEAKDLN